MYTVTENIYDNDTATARTDVKDANLLKSMIHVCNSKH